jgi:hypothetical protein
MDLWSIISFRAILSEQAIQIKPHYTPELTQYNVFNDNQNVRIACKIQMRTGAGHDDVAGGT